MSTTRRELLTTFVLAQPPAQTKAASSNEDGTRTMGNPQHTPGRVRAHLGEGGGPDRYRRHRGPPEPARPSWLKAISWALLVVAVWHRRTHF
ncbi:MAG TPA: hypothetical protein VFW93_17205 [Aquabacterium sp.]|uniref:hypothetical protein n=1 Tax=Aquabacterium sp. TaxID=1872578 RepID=UPI002E31265A|nr:hypothetical protein [Aquabacterium sp.]HEX5357943.1 hypothetical protein [Aquabacterium sp.]